MLQATEHFHKKIQKLLAINKSIKNLIRNILYIIMYNKHVYQ